MSYSVEYKDKGFYLTMTGSVTLDEIDSANALILGSENFDMHDFQIINLLEADFSKINHADAKGTGAMDWAGSKSRLYVKVALIVNDDASTSFCEEYISTAKGLGQLGSSNFF